jgi:hypothetical protein
VLVLLILFLCLLCVILHKLNVSLFGALSVLAPSNVSFLFIKDIVEIHGCPFEPFNRRLEICDFIVAHKLASQFSLLLLHESEFPFDFDHLAAVSLQEVLLVLGQSADEVRVDGVNQSVEAQDEVPDLGEG